MTRRSEPAFGGAMMAASDGVNEVEEEEEEEGEDGTEAAAAAVVDRSHEATPGGSLSTNRRRR